MSDLTGKKLGVYEVQQLIGRGGMAAVYRAYHPTTSRQVAIKVLLPDLEKDATFRKRFERESKILAGLQHIHILPVFDYGQDDDIAYLVMPLLPGTTLLHHLREGHMESKEIVRIFRQLASALDYAHARGLLHRDIKPGNVLLDDSSNAMLADFGLTRMADSSAMSRLTSDSSVVGTPAYMSPEQGQGLELDHRSDLYSMGIMLYEMLTGQVPYRADTPVAIIFKHITEPIPRARVQRADLPEAVDAVLQKAMAKLPEDRYPSATAIVDALEDALEGRTSPDESILLSDHPSMMTPDVIVKPVVNVPVASAPVVNTPVVNAPVADMPVTPVDNGINTLDFGMRPKRKRDDEKPTGSVIAKAAMLAITAVVVALAGILGVAGGIIGSSAMPPAMTLTPEAPKLTQIETDSEVVALAFNKDGSRVVAGMKDNSAAVWDTAKLKRLFTLEAHSGDVLSVAYSPDGSEIMTGGADNTMYKWDATEGTTFLTDMEGSAVRGVVYSATHYAYITRQNLAAGVQSTNGGVSFFSPSPDDNTLYSLAISPNEGRIATGDEHGNVYIWRLATGKVVHTFQGGESPVVSVGFSHDSATVIAADSAGSVRFWPIPDEDDAAVTHQPKMIIGTGAGLMQMAVSPDGTLIATAHEDGTLRIWSGTSGEFIASFNDTTEALNSVTFSSNGKWLASGGDDKHITLRAVADLVAPKES